MSEHQKITTFVVINEQTETKLCLKIFRFLLLPAVLLSALFTAQAQQNVEWKSEVESLGDGNYRIVLTAAIPERFHMYDITGPYDEMGPNATVITFALPSRAPA